MGCVACKPVEPTNTLRFDVKMGDRLRVAHHVVNVRRNPAFFAVLAPQHYAETRIERMVVPTTHRVTANKTMQIHPQTEEGADVVTLKIWQTVVRDYPDRQLVAKTVQKIVCEFFHD